jgi:hypothetical protein
LATREVVPDEDEAVEVIVAFPKLDVPPLESKEFT